MFEKTRAFSTVRLGRRSSIDTSKTSTKSPATKNLRRRSLDFLRSVSSRRVLRFDSHDTCEETSVCSSADSTLIPTPLRLLESELGGESPSTTPVPVTVPSVVSGAQANAFLDKVQSSIYEQQNRISILNQSIQQQTGIAKGRYVNGNATGDCLAMKKVKKLERERQLALRAMNMAMDAAVEIQVAMHRATAVGTTAPLRIEIGEHGKILANVQHMLLEKETEIRVSRKKLLELVEALF